MRTRLLVLVLLVALGATACSSSAKTAAPAAPTTTNAKPTTSLPTTAPPTTVGTGTSGTDFCTRLEDDADTFGVDDIMRSTSPAQIKTVYAGVTARLDQTVAQAPAAMRGDLSTLNDGIKQLVQALAKAGYDTTKLTPDALAALSDPQIETAQQHIDTYLAQTCHVTPS